MTHFCLISYLMPSELGYQILQEQKSSKKHEKTYKNDHIFVFFIIFVPEVYPLTLSTPPNILFLSKTILEHVYFHFWTYFSLIKNSQKMDFFGSITFFLEELRCSRSILRHITGVDLPKNTIFIVISKKKGSGVPTWFFRKILYTIIKIKK